VVIHWLAVRLQGVPARPDAWGRQALALGADAVLLGRPVLWGLALDGCAGVAAVLDTLRRELALNLALNGCTRLADVTRAHVLAPAEVQARL